MCLGEGSEESLSADGISSYSFGAVYDEYCLKKKLEEESGSPNQAELEEQSGSPNQDVIEKFLKGGLGCLNEDGATRNFVSPYQGTHDGEAGPSRRSPEKTTQQETMEEKVIQISRASHDTKSGKKRRGPPPTEEQKNKRKIADEKYRNKKKKERETMAQTLTKLTIEKEQLESELTRMKTTVVQQEDDLCQHQNKMRKMEEELREHRRMINQYLKAITRQEQLADFCSNELVNSQRPLATPVSEIQPLVSEMPQKVEKLENDVADIKRLMYEVLAEIHDMKARRNI